MIYHQQLNTGHQISIENRGMQTIVNITFDRDGQHQRSSSNFTSGQWTMPPELELTADGGILTLNTDTGKSIAIVRGGNIQITSHSHGCSQTTTSNSSHSSSDFTMPKMPKMPKW